MTVHSLTEALEESNALIAIAKHAGVTIEQARCICADLSDLPIDLQVRICGTAYRDRVRQANRMARQ